MLYTKFTWFFWKVCWKYHKMSFPGHNFAFWLYTQMSFEENFLCTFILFHCCLIESHAMICCWIGSHKWVVLVLPLIVMWHFSLDCWILFFLHFMWVEVVICGLTTIVISIKKSVVYQCIYDGHGWVGKNGQFGDDVIKQRFLTFGVCLICGNMPSYYCMWQR